VKNGSSEGIILTKTMALGLNRQRFEPYNELHNVFLYTERLQLQSRTKRFFYILK